MENYSTNSRCFNHGEEWSERTCLQVRQWQHWGSGCYYFDCFNGRIRIHVSNYTYICYKAGQIIPIRTFHRDWLHEGKIICPACSELCPANQCPPDSEKPIDVIYQSDYLVCAASILVAYKYNLLVTFLLLFSFIKQPNSS